MPHASPFAAWETFYVIVGSAAAALTGLQFVTIALVADHRRERKSIRDAESVRAFGTPTVVHFAAVLFFSALVAAPWPSVAAIAIALAASAVLGFLYLILVIRRARRQTDYVMVTEDLIFYIWLPMAAYALLLVAAMLLPSQPIGLFLVAAVSLGLLFIGIHNSWDAVTYIAIDLAAAREEREEKEKGQHHRRR